MVGDILTENFVPICSSERGERFKSYTIHTSGVHQKIFTLCNMRRQLLSSKTASPLIATPEVLAAFSRAKTQSSRKGTRSVAIRALGICMRARTLVCRASRALSTLFGGLAILIGDHNDVQVQDFAILPLHHRLGAPTLYDGFLAVQTICGSGPERLTDRGGDVYQVSSSRTSRSSARSLSSDDTGEAINGVPLWPQKYAAYRLEESANEGSSASCEDWEIVDAKEENELESFPKYADCVCLSCQGYDVPEILGDHHNTECPCERCKPMAVTGVSHRFPLMKGGQRTKGARTSHSPPLPPL